MVEKFLHEQHSRAKLFADSAVPSSTFTQYLAACLATLGALAIGTHLSWTSSALPMLKDSESDVVIDDIQGAWIGSLITLGGCMGAVPTGSITSWLGPKRTLQIVALPLLASWYMIAFSGCIWGLYAARFLAGLGTGAVCVAAPMYVAELAEPKIRGTLGTFFQLQITIGLLFGFILGGTIHDFKLLALISSAVPIVFLLTFSFMPESPVFLCTKGRIKEAKQSLQYFRGANYDVEDEFLRIRENVENTTSNNAGLFDLLKCRATVKGLVVSLALMFFQQLSGINAVLFYAASIFEESASAIPPSICAIVIGVVQVVATYLSTLLIDRLGRKILLIISGSIMAICLGILGVYFHFHLRNYDLTYYASVPLVCIATFIVVFSVGYGPIPWMMVGELFSPAAKGFAGSSTAAFNWILSFAVTRFFQPVQDELGLDVTFGILGIVCAGGAIFAILMVPETKGKDLQQVQSMLLGKNIDRCLATDEKNDECIKVDIKT